MDSSLQLAIPQLHADRLQGVDFVSSRRRLATITECFGYSVLGKIDFSSAYAIRANSQDSLLFIRHEI
jgi:hypothetical protein